MSERSDRAGTVPPSGPPIAVLLRRLQPRPGAPGDESDVLGRCEGGALSAALDAGTSLDAPVIAIAVGPIAPEASSPERSPHTTIRAPIFFTAAASTLASPR